MTSNLPPMTPERLKELAWLKANKRALIQEEQKKNTHALPDGYTAMPTIQRDGVGWELHPPSKMEVVAGKSQLCRQGSIWYLRNLQECQEAVSRHKAYFQRTEQTSIQQEA